ncbi:M24 family metallopeptidase [Mesorhizobium terrae]
MRKLMDHGTGQIIAAAFPFLGSSTFEATMYLNRTRAEQLMTAAGVEALVLFSPENFRYATGTPAGAAAMWRRAGGAIAVVPASADAPIASIISDFQLESSEQSRRLEDVRTFPAWVDMADYRDIPDDAGLAESFQSSTSALVRPATFDRNRVFDLLDDVLRERGLQASNIGADFDFLPARDLASLSARLPNQRFVDATDLIRRLRLVKSPAETANLRSACRLAEAGLKNLSENIAAGHSSTDLSSAWRSGVDTTARSTGVGAVDTWDYISVGVDPWDGNAKVVPGSVVKADVGCIVSGYCSDSARTYVFGEPSRLAAGIFSCLEQAFMDGLGMFRPGVMLRDIHAATLASIQRYGLKSYSRGHFGHSVGAAVGIEEWPFISADSEIVLEPGMVMAFETPFLRQWSWRTDDRGSASHHRKWL